MSSDPVYSYSTADKFGFAIITLISIVVLIFSIFINKDSIPDIPVVLQIIIDLAILIAIFEISSIHHEAGHAIAGALAGIKISKIQIGPDNGLIKFQLAGVEISYGPSGISGVTILEMIPRQFFRSRFFICTLGGPAFTMAAMLAGASFLNTKYDVDLTSISPSPVIFILFTNFLIILITMVPYSQKDGSPSSNDIRKLVEIPFMTDEQIEYLQETLEISRGNKVLCDYGEEAAEQIFSQSLLFFPRSKRLMFNLASCMLDQGKCNEALSVLDNAIAVESQPEMDGPIYLQMALVHFTMDLDRSMPSLVECSDKAYEILPEDHYAIFFKSAALILTGKADEGIVLLESIVDHKDNSSKHYIYQAFLAYGYHLHGLTKKALKIVEQMASLPKPDSMPEKAILDNLLKRSGNFGIPS